MLSEFEIHSGITCSSCANRLEKGLLKHSQVKNASVNFAMMTAAVDSSLNSKELIDYMSSLGFEAVLKQSLLDLQQRELKSNKKQRMELILCFFLAFPTVFFNMFFPYLSSSGWIQFICASLIIIYPGRHFFVEAFFAARHRSANMSTLVATSSIFAWIYSSFLFFFPNHHHAHYFFETTAVLIFFVLIGKYLEGMAKNKASEGLRSLAALRPDISNLITKPTQENKFSSFEEIIEIRTIFLKESDRVLVKSGEKIPADGKVFFGESEVDNSFLTGESKPLHIKAGDRVFAGSLNVLSPLEITIEKTVGNSEIDKIVSLVAQAQNSKTSFQRLADKISSVFVPAIIVLSIFCFAGWMMVTKDIEISLMRSISVLVVACPCALGLATPISILVASGRAAKNGILMKEASVLEVLSKVNSIVFDKTGTLTKGKMQIVQWNFLDLWTQIDFQAVYLAEKNSNHPIAKAILDWLQSQSLWLEIEKNKDLPEIKSIQEIPGSGVKIYLENYEYEIGKDENEVKEKSEFSKIIVKRNGILIGNLFAGDKLRDEAKSTVSKLNSIGIETILCSGDHEYATQQVAKEVCIEKFYFLQSPENKLKLIENLRLQNKIVAMVGDGINDAPALSAASVAIGLDSGTTLANSSAQIILKNSSIESIYEIILISKNTSRIIKENLFWAFSYNVVLIPMAALGYLNPILASLFMGLSSVIVVLNSLRIR